MYSPWKQSRGARKRPQSAVPRLEILEERRLLSATQDDPIAEPLALTGGAEFRVNTTTAGDQLSPRVTAFADGGFAIIWKHNDYPTFQRYDAAGNSVGNETQTTWTKGFAAVAADGTSIVAYDSGTELRARRHDASGNTVGGSFIVNTLPLSGISGVQVYTDSDGNHTFVWRGSTTNPEMLYYRRYSSAGTPLTGQTAIGESSGPFFTDSNPAGDLLIAYDSELTLVKGSGEVVHAPLPNPLSQQSITAASVDITPAGNFAVQYSGNSFVYVQRFDATGLPDGQPVDVMYTPASVGMLAVEPGGDFVLVADRNYFGYESGGSGRAVIAQRFDASGTAEPAFLVNTYVAGDQRSPSAVMLDSSTFVVAWRSAGQDGGGQGIFAKKFADDDLPTVELVSPEEGPSITDGETLLSQIAGLRITFSRPMNEASVESPANWQLLDDGIDVSSLIAGVTYENDVAYVTFSEPLRGTGYELIVHDSIQDTLGRALDGDNNAAAGGDYSITFSVRQGIVGIGPERIIHGEVNSPSGSPVVAIQEDGGFAVGYNTGGWIPVPAMTEVRVFDPDGQTSSPIVAFESYSSGLMSLGNGQYLAHINGGVRLFDATGAGPQTAFVGGGFHSGMQQRAARQNNGSFIVAKTVSVSGDFDVYIQRFAANGSSLGPAIPLSPPGDGIQQGAPAIYVMDNDQFVVAWGSESIGVPGNAVQFRRFAADGVPIGNTTEVAANSNYSGGLDIAGDAMGNFTIVWADRVFAPVGEANIYVRRFNHDSQPISGATHLRTILGGVLLAPSIAMDDSGRSIISWKESTDVYAQAFNAKGNSIVDPFVINSLPAPTNYVFAPVEMNGAGEAVVAWASASNDIRARRLSLGAFPVLDLNGAAEGIDFATDKDPGELLLPIVDADELTITTSSPTLVGATIQMDPSLIGGELGIDTSGTNITATYTASGVTLSGVDTVANYQQVLRTVVFAPPYSFEGGQTTEIEFTIDDGSATSPIATARVRNTAPAEVLGRHLYYAGAKYDDPLPGPHYNNAAYDTSKTAYQAGSGGSTFANVSSYTRGINGIVLFTNGDYGVPSLSDFTFKMGTSTDPGTWLDAPAPSAITFREGAGTGGTDILEITWLDGAIKNTWLEVTMLANENTGLAADDVFYFGSRVGDTGLSNSANAALTSAADQLAVRAHPAIGVGVENPYDFDRNGAVSAGDELTARFNPGILLMLNLPAAAAQSMAVPLALAEPSRALVEIGIRADHNAVASALPLKIAGEDLRPAAGLSEPTASNAISPRIVPEALALVLENDDDLALEIDEPAPEVSSRESLLEPFDAL